MARNAVIQLLYNMIEATPVFRKKKANVSMENLKYFISFIESGAVTLL